MNTRIDEALAVAAQAAGADSPPSTTSVLKGVAEDYNRSAASVDDATSNLHDLLTNLRGPAPVDEGLVKNPNGDRAPSDLAAVGDAQSQLRDAIGPLHDAINDLRAVLGY